MSKDEQMDYGILGDDNSSTEEKLEKYTGEVDWTYLKKHFEAGSLIYLDPCLDITTVGKALTDDDKDAIIAWRDKGDLVQPCELHAEHWETSGETFRALVVSPFVLMQPVDKEG
ncbi:MAG: DUF2288 family protein [Verrucomicrobiota bacterium]